MKKVFFLLLTAVLVLSCQDKSKLEKETAGENFLFETTFSDYEELQEFSSYKKESDTSVHMGGWQDDYRLLNLRKNGDYLVVFYRVAEWDSEEIHPASYRAIDTIQVKNIKANERVTVGYCYHEDYYEGEVIALIKENDSIYATDIIKAWRANPESEQIELLQDHEGIKCLNEFFEKDNASIPIEEMS